MLLEFNKSSWKHKLKLLIKGESEEIGHCVKLPSFANFCNLLLLELVLIAICNLPRHFFF